MYRDRDRLARLWKTERRLFRDTHPQSERLYREAVRHLPDGERHTIAFHDAVKSLLA